jgi:hypothetical protein bfra3_16308
MDDINKRLVSVLNYFFDGNVSEMARKTNVPQPTLNNIVANRLSKPSTENLSRIANSIELLNTGWLLTGEGEMLRTATDDSAADKQKALPLIPFEALAGYLSTDNEGVRLEDCERYVIPEFDRRGAEFIIRVSGSSMYPKYSNGDLLGCKKIENILFFQWGKIYVLDTSQGALVKRVYEHENKDFVMLVSDNKDVYPPFPIPKSDIRSLSIVVGGGKIGIIISII